jgi:hypothetical protein
MKCIFCTLPSDDSVSVEHIIPESLGNDKYILDKGIVCDKCNNYFSHAIEEPLLNLQYFKSIRHRLNIVSKKGKIPSEKGFMFNPETEVEFHTDKHKEKSISFNDEKAIVDVLNKDTFEVFIPIFSSPGNNNIHVSKFLGKLAIEALALYALQNNLNIEDNTNQESLKNLKRFVRRGNKNEYWPYHIRQLYHPDAGFQNLETKEYLTILTAMNFIYTDNFFLFHQFLILGTEFTIDLTNPTLSNIIEWLEKNNGRSPVLEAAMKQYGC